jgi:hypothetical protein
MQIYEAAFQALRDLARPTHVREIYTHILENRYFEFGALDPVRVLGVQIDRHSKGVSISKPALPILFYRSSPATYALLEWLDPETSKNLSLDEEINKSAELEALDTALFLEQELQRWLFRNWEQSRLVALEFGPLELFDPEQQTRKLGKYNTGVVGEIDLLFKANTGDLLVCELKRQSDDQTIGQLCRYWGWVNETLASGNQVYGLVLAQEISPSLRYAIKATNQNLSYRELSLDVKLGPKAR